MNLNETETDQINTFYDAQVLMYNGDIPPAIEMFKKHIENSKSDIEEKTQCMIFIGDLTKDIEWYHKAFLLNSYRRKPLIKLAEYFFKLKDYQKTICYIKAALEIKYLDRYINDISDYEDNPLWLLYYSYYYNGDFEKSKNYFDLCLNFNSISKQNEKYLNDYKYYYSLPKISIIGFCDISNIIYPEDKLELLSTNNNSTGEYIILSDDIKSMSTLMIEYLKLINKEESKLLLKEKILSHSDFKIINLNKK